MNDIDATCLVLIEVVLKSRKVIVQTYCDVFCSFMEQSNGRHSFDAQYFMQNCIYIWQILSAVWCHFSITT